MERVPVSPSFTATVRAASRPGGAHPVDRSVVALSGLSIVVALAATGAAVFLSRTIALVTNAAWLGRLSLAQASPAGNALGVRGIAVPVVGGLLVGLMARFGSPAIRGHGIPEAMETVLVAGSRIPARVAILKPLSAAIAIGTGGPFGAEGPIIATGGALGSLAGQLLRTSADERKILLAAGAAAGMAATFGTPIASVLLAVELLLFEFRARSLVPVAFAATTATAARAALGGRSPMFALSGLAAPTPGAIAAYVLLGALAGVAAVAVTRGLYAVEDAFERLPIHWMWWPAIGGVVVGAVGLVAPHTLGVGYGNVQDLLDGRLALGAAAALAIWKLVSWTVALGSGTSGGTLAPLLTIGGGLGAAAGAIVGHAFPGAGVDPRLAALVCMSAMFAGASRATLTSLVFALEITQAPAVAVPLLGGTAAAALVSWLLMRESIMTAKIARRGIRALGEYEADLLAQVPVRAAATAAPVALEADAPLSAARAFLASAAPGSGHQGFPVVDAEGRIVGVLTRRDLLAPVADLAVPVRTLVTRTPVVVGGDASLRDAVEAMLDADVGRLPVVDDDGRLAGILTRSDVLAANRRRIEGRRRPRRPRRPAPAA